MPYSAPVPGAPGLLFALTYADAPTSSKTSVPLNVSSSAAAEILMTTRTAANSRVADPDHLLALARASTHSPSFRYM